MCVDGDLIYINRKYLIIWELSYDKYGIGIKV